MSTQDTQSQTYLTASQWAALLLLAQQDAAFRQQLECDPTHTIRRYAAEKLNIQLERVLCLAPTSAPTVEPLSERVPFYFGVRSSQEAGRATPLWQHGNASACGLATATGCGTAASGQTSASACGLATATGCGTAASGQTSASACGLATATGCGTAASGQALKAEASGCGLATATGCGTAATDAAATETHNASPSDAGVDASSTELP